MMLATWRESDGFMSIKYATIFKKESFHLYKHIYNMIQIISYNDIKLDFFLFLVHESYARFDKTSFYTRT